MLSLLLGVALADSPLTSTDFHTAYLDHPRVQEAVEADALTSDLANFLSKGKRGLDLKVAVVNALGWNFDGQNNAEVYARFLARRDKLTPDAVLADPRLIKPHEALVLGYLLALDDYFEPARALPFVEAAETELPKSKTAALIAALVRAQLAMESSWCTVFTEVDAAAQNERLRPDLKFEAETIIVEYIRLYADSCPACGGVSSVEVSDQAFTELQVKQAWERHAEPVCECLGDASGPQRFAVTVSPLGVVIGVDAPEERVLPSLECAHEALGDFRFPAAEGEREPVVVSWTVESGRRLAE